jgi:hypothetical protein
VSNDGKAYEIIKIRDQPNKESTFLYLNCNEIDRNIKIKIQNINNSKFHKDSYLLTTIFKKNVIFKENWTLIKDTEKSYHLEKTYDKEYFIRNLIRYGKVLIDFSDNNQQFIFNTNNRVQFIKRFTLTSEVCKISY